MFFNDHIGLLSSRSRYSLTSQKNGRQNVCLEMFKRTLGLKSYKRIYKFLKGRKNNPNTFTIDHRGKHTPSNKLDNTPIIAHIESYKPEQSHYRKEHAPHRRYLPSELTITAMYNDYKSRVGDAAPAYNTYRKIFRERKISFGVPLADQCPECLIHENHKRARENGEDQGCSDDCHDCAVATEHLFRIINARTMIREDAKNIPEDTDVFTVDMQKVILLPKLTTKETVFTSRVICYNETFARLSSGTDLCVLWHEAIAGRNAEQVASAYIKAVKLSGKKHIIFWVDNCTAQNKNWTLFTALLMCVNQPDGPESLTIRFLETGHTHMRADAIHGNIGRRLKKESEIICFDDLVDLCRQSGQDIEVCTMEFSDFFKFQNHARNNTKKYQKPKMANIKEVIFTKGKDRMEIREGFFIGPMLESDFIANVRKPQLYTMPPRETAPRGITSKKRDGIIQILRTNSQQDAKKFYETIPINGESKDLCTDRTFSIAE